MAFWNRKEKRNESVVTYETDPITALSALFGKKFDVYNSTAISAFFAAQELISNSIAQLPIIVKQDNVKLPSHPVNFLFKNTLMTKYNFMKQMISDVIMYGDAYAYIERTEDGTPIRLIYCEHGDCTMHYNKTKQEITYTVFCRKGRVEAIDVIHLYKNSDDGVQGKSIRKLANNILKLAHSTDDAAMRYYSSGCSIQGALTIKGSRRGAKEAARQAFQDTHNGTSGSGLVILDDDMDYKPMSSNANESQMLQARLFNVSEIARYFNINPVLLGDLSKTSYNSIEQANMEYVSHTLSPYVTMVEEEFNRKLIKPSEKNVVIDLDETSLLKTDKSAMSNYLKSLTSSGIMTLNEAREIIGLEAKEGADDLIISYTNVNSNTIGNEDKVEDDKNTDKKDEQN